MSKSYVARDYFCIIEDPFVVVGKQKQQEMNKNKEIIVLNHKRSNAINIGMTKLPPPRSIKTAILKMDATIMNREGIEVRLHVRFYFLPLMDLHSLMTITKFVLLKKKKL